MGIDYITTLRQNIIKAQTAYDAIHAKCVKHPTDENIGERNQRAADIVIAKSRLENYGKGSFIETHSISKYLK